MRNVRESLTGHHKLNAIFRGRALMVRRYHQYLLYLLIRSVILPPSALKSMAAYRTAFGKAMKFGTQIEDSLNINHSVFFERMLHLKCTAMQVMQAKCSVLLKMNVCISAVPNCNEDTCFTVS